MSKKGFTLIEILAIVVLLGIITGIAIPKIVDYVDESEQRTFVIQTKLVLSMIDDALLSNPQLDITLINLDYLKSNIKLKTNNFSSMKVKDIGGHAFIILYGAGAWNKYVTYGTYNNVLLDETATYIENSTPPTIVLNGNSTVALTRGTPFTDPGTTYSDDVDSVATLDSQYHINSSLNTNKIGTYTLIYTVYDSSGNKNSVSRTVVVNE